MNSIIFSLTWFGCEVCVMIVCCLCWYRRGYIKGARKGYENGRVDAERWWLEQGAAVSKTREKIWKEECR